MFGSGQNRLSAAMPAMPAFGKKRKFAIFIQKSIYRMSEFGGKAEVFRKHSQVQKVP
jgi:hypothetical protein